MADTQFVKHLSEAQCAQETLMACVRFSVELYTRLRHMYALRYRVLAMFTTRIVLAAFAGRSLPEEKTGEAAARTTHA